MNTPTPLAHQTVTTTHWTIEPNRRTPGPGDIFGVDEVDGPLVRQPAPAARLALILHNAATELWDLCTLADAEQMAIEARAVAARILTAAPGE